MRARVIVLVLAILFVAGFAALNWPEMQRITPLNFGLFITEGQPGLILLGMLAVALVAFLVSSAAQEARYVVHTRQHHRELERQRDLADKAEASRFTELRTHLDTQLRDLNQREAIAATELERSMVNSQRELRTQLESMNRLLATRLSEIESRLDARLGGRKVGEPPLMGERQRVVEPLDPMRRDPLHPDPLAHRDPLHAGDPLREPAPHHDPLRRERV